MDTHHPDTSACPSLGTFISTGGFVSFLLLEHFLVLKIYVKLKYNSELQLSFMLACLEVLSHAEASGFT